MPDDEVEYELERPFVTVVSNGGPHDDESYVSGFQMGQLDVILGTPWIQMHTFTFHTTSVKQADLIAMHFGFKMEIEQQDDTWTTATFSLICTCDETVPDEGSSP